MVQLRDYKDSAVQAVRDSFRSGHKKTLLVSPTGSGKTVIFITHSVEEAVFLGTRVIVMSPRPGQVVHDQHSPFGPDHPRDRVMRSSPEFTALRQQISQVIDDSAGGHDLPTTA